MINDFTKLMQASMRPITAVGMTFIVGWCLTCRIEIPQWYVVLYASVLAYLFGERKASKTQ